MQLDTTEKCLGVMISFAGSLTRSLPADISVRFVVLGYILNVAVVQAHPGGSVGNAGRVTGCNKERK